MNPAAPVMTALGIRCLYWKLETGSRPLKRGPVQAAHQCEPHDLDVEADGPVLDVVEVVLDALLERGVAAPAVDLRPASDARLDLVAEHVLRNAVLELRDEVGTLGPWADDRHVPLEHVPELRELVDVEPPEDPADWCRTRVVVARPDRAGVVLGPLGHRSELVDVERLPVEPHPLLRIEDRPGRGPLDEQRDDPKEEREESQGTGRNPDIDAALEDVVEPR